MTYVDVARAVSDRGEVVLRRRPGRRSAGPGVLELRVNGVFVMDTEETSTEQALARSALALGPEPRAVLVGGLGLGFTAAEVLADHRVQRVRVVEVEPAVVAWLRDGTVAHGPALLADPRLEVVVEDVRRVVAGTTPGSVDLLLLDVDNGPDFLVHDTNAEVYATAFLAQAAATLRPGGVLVVWSSTRSAPLLGALAATGLVDVAATALPVDLQGREEHYWLHTARTPDFPTSPTTPHQEAP